MSREAPYQVAAKHSLHILIWVLLLGMQHPLELPEVGPLRRAGVTSPKHSVYICVCVCINMLMHLLIRSLCVCVFVYMNICVWKSEDNLQESAVSLCHREPKVFRFGGKYLYIAS